MSKYQEALDYLKAFAEQWVVNYEKLKNGNIDNVDFTECDGYSKALQELVDRATPIKFVYREFMKNTPQHEFRESCPNCNNVFDYDELGKKHCCYCGQALDWNR